MLKLTDFVNSEEKREGSTLYRGLISEGNFYKLIRGLNDKGSIYDDCYTKAFYSNDMRAIIQYTEGDLTAEIFEDQEKFNQEVIETGKWYQENY